MATCAGRTSDVSEPRCGHPCATITQYSNTAIVRQGSGRSIEGTRKDG